ncbi:MAG TPA: hypothetical protein DEA05_08095 [Rhodobacteraceae bacterium]|nr:hypothetical protein [Paracoccaceae bacterium]
MRIDRRAVGAGLLAMLAGGPAAAFGTSKPKESPLPGIDITLTRSPEGGAPLDPFHIDAEHGKALVQMGAMQAGQFMANILAPKLETMTGISGRSWHWVLSNHLSEEVVRTLFKGGGSELKALQFAEDEGATTWGIAFEAVEP